MEPKLISGGTRFSTLPKSYVRPEPERPKLSEVVYDEDIPLIDLACEDRSLVLKLIADACQEYGLFQVINHGVSKELVGDMVRIGHEFFSLPMEEKMKYYSDDTSKTMRLSTSFNVKAETVHNWRDCLRFHCYPLENYVHEWPSVPPSFKDITINYCTELRKLGFKLEEAISESLGLGKGSLMDVLGEQGEFMSFNYYPACPEPEMTFGLPAHTDVGALTILLQDLQVSGLQILKDGKWLEVKPRPGAFVINIGDQLQALTNGKYKSIKHRVVVNANKARMSVACFLCPCNTAVIRAPKELLSHGSPAIYKDFTYEEYHKTFYSQILDRDCLELFKN